MTNIRERSFLYQTVFLTPSEHVDGERLGSEFLKDKVRWDTKRNIRDSEDGHGDIVIITLHVKRLGHPRNFRIPSAY